MVHCTGCHRSFTVSGYTLHVQRTRSSVCVAAYHAQLNHGDNVDTMDEDELDEDDETPDEDNHDVETPFSGDFFGVYQDDDFDWPDDEDEGMYANALCITIYNSCPDESQPGCAINEDLIDVARPTGDAPTVESCFEIEEFPLPTAGAPIPCSDHGPSSFEAYQQTIGGDNDYAPYYAPFQSHLDWDIARWAKMHGPSSSAVTKLLEIEGVRQQLFYSQHLITLHLQFSETLGLSYSNVRELNKIIDTKLPHPPRFHRQDVTIGGEKVTMYSRNIIECVKALFGSAEFASRMIYKPERHYDRESRHERHYHDMHTGDWWWEMQVGKPPLLY
jgi:hypothetical protein